MTLDAMARRQTAGVASPAVQVRMAPGRAYMCDGGLWFRQRRRSLPGGGPAQGDAQREFGGDIGQIIRALSAILNDASGVVGHGRTLFGSENGSSASFLTRIKQTLAHASTLIGTCESAGRSVDQALAVVEDTLAKFRQAIAGLAEATVDITLIGMNAGLKASHLASRGSAFVVIANEPRRPPIRSRPAPAACGPCSTASSAPPMS
ncbi:hypothetical protein ABID58_004521 [Bradyrhizobium sp. S3.2.6]|uniref:hypothetical protein n=1 Tax=Bradyrhizobium sp. S3.2.6 TaxID=3156428 RepID=UPI003398F4BF